MLPPLWRLFLDASGGTGHVACLGVSVLYGSLLVGNAMPKSKSIPRWFLPAQTGRASPSPVQWLCYVLCFWVYKNPQTSFGGAWGGRICRRSCPQPTERTQTSQEDTGVGRTFYEMKKHTEYGVGYKPLFTFPAYPLRFPRNLTRNLTHIPTSI